MHQPTDRLLHQGSRLSRDCSCREQRSLSHLSHSLLTEVPGGPVPPVTMVAVSTSPFRPKSEAEPKLPTARCLRG